MRTTILVLCLVTACGSDLAASPDEASEDASQRDKPGKDEPGEVDDDAGASPIQADGDAGQVTIVRPAPVSEHDAYFDTACGTRTLCPEQPHPGYDEKTESNLCYSSDGTNSGTCTFLCAYRTVVGGKEMMVSIAGRGQVCSELGGECYPIGANVYCLAAGTSPNCGDDPNCD